MVGFILSSLCFWDKKTRQPQKLSVFSEKKPLAVVVIEPQFLLCPGCSLVTIPHNYRNPRLPHQGNFNERTLRCKLKYCKLFPPLKFYWCTSLHIGKFYYYNKVLILLHLKSSVCYTEKFVTLLCCSWTQHILNCNLICYVKAVLIMNVMKEILYIYNF